MASVDVQAREQLLAAREQLLERVQEQALAEAARARQEVVLAFVEQALDVVRLVDVVAVLSRSVRNVCTPIGSLRLTMTHLTAPHRATKPASVVRGCPGAVLYRVGGFGYGW